MAAAAAADKDTLPTEGWRGMQDRFETELIDALPALRRYALSLCLRADMADDLVQTAAERALAGRQGLEPGSRLQPWLFRILRNAWIDDVRRTATRGTELDVHEMPEAVVHDGAHAIEASMLLRETETALAALAPEHREVIALVCIEELTYAEAASVLGIPVGTVMSRLARGRLALAEKMGIK